MDQFVALKIEFPADRHRAMGHATHRTCARFCGRLPMADVFINYRTDDAGYAAGLVYERLQAEFGAENVFRDCRSMHGGADFPDELWSALRGSAVLLVIIGPDWLTLKDASGRRRIDNPDDFVRREIEEAFSRSIRVMPVLLDGVKPLVGSDLPTDLAALAVRQVVTLRRRHDGADLDHLVKELQLLVSRRQPGKPKGNDTPSRGGVRIKGNAKVIGPVIGGDVNGNVEGPQAGFGDAR
ncbi:toll/interleukin-1 receptor domain-containing protein [Micromonospora sp. SD12]|uniref:toll/interleukin-1 receptor domain-containing protein n=1 Tax=Micromonospora sp. SD12 TaxID=3452216 RepID=UPI003F89DEEB